METWSFAMWKMVMEFARNYVDRRELECLRQSAEAQEQPTKAEKLRG